MATTSETVKNAGLKNLVQMSEITGRNVSTLKDWHKNDRQAFEVMLIGCVALVANPFGLWLRPGVLLGVEYEGPVIYKTAKGSKYVGFIKAGKIWNEITVESILEGNVVSVLAFKAEG